MSAILERDGRFLVVEEMVDGVQKISQPAGQVDAGESPSEAAVRETLEESGVTFVPAHLVGIYQWYVPGINTIHLLLCYTGKLYVPSGHPPAPSDPGILAVRWLTPEELLHERDRHRSPFVMLCVGDYLKGCRYPLDIVTSLQTAMLNS